MWYSSPIHPSVYTPSPAVLSFFFFQAEDGIRDKLVTGVQTCALPIYGAGVLQRRAAAGDQGRRPDRRARSDAHRQRADGGRAGLRPRQEEGRDDRRVRDRKSVV